MHISMTADVAPGSSPRPSILRSAEIMASGFFVISTDPASASNSRERDNASLTTCESSQASAIKATATMTMMIAPPPELLLLLSEEDEDPPDDEDDDEDHDEPLLVFHSRLVNIRKNSSPKNPTAPAMITATTMSCTSPLRIWVSSWPSTDSISGSLSARNSPVVTVIAYCRRFSPVANAFNASLSMIFSFGIGMPREMQRFSRT